MIEARQEYGIWTVIINRPEKANALSLGVLERLDAVFENAQKDPNLRALVLTAAGEKVFCAGADLGLGDDVKELARHPMWEQVSARLADLPCLTVAALNGTVVGGGFGVVLACDLRICTPAARFFYPVLKRGLLPQPHDVKRLASLVGTSRAKMMLIGGQKWNAIQALSYGLVEEVLPLEQFGSWLDRTLSDVLAQPTHKSFAIKAMFDHRFGNTELADLQAAVYDSDAAAIHRVLRKD